MSELARMRKEYGEDTILIQPRKEDYSQDELDGVISEIVEIVEEQGKDKEYRFDEPYDASDRSPVGKIKNELKSFYRELDRKRKREIKSGSSLNKQLRKAEYELLGSVGLGGGAATAFLYDGVSGPEEFLSMAAAEALALMGGCKLGEWMSEKVRERKLKRAKDFKETQKYLESLPIDFDSEIKKVDSLVEEIEVSE